MATRGDEKFAVFDIDGTLIRWQLYHAVVSSIAKAGHLGPEADKTLKDARMQWKRRIDPEAFHRYERVLVDLYEISFLSLQPEVFDKHIKQVMDEYHDQTYTYTRDLITKLKQRNYILLAISGSPQEIVQTIAEEYGFDDFVGSYYERQNGAFTGKITVPAHDKKTNLERLITKHQLDLKDSIAIGDSNSDIPMLEMVEYPIAFNPNQKLFEHAKQYGWKIVIERKNVVYELEPKNGSYILA